jgi:DNA polymerase I-like protein with 3'-5' exonuclease and polymerase domains
MYTIDFETEGIEGNPIVRPPKPVGVAIKDGDKPAKYLAWGHPSENNSTQEQARKELLKAVKSGRPLLFHNAPFDLSVWACHLDLPRVAPQNIFDTQYSIFLVDPYAPTFSLKPSAERILGQLPEEQDAVKAWVLANVAEARQKPSTWGAYISRAPGKLVGTYAIGDVDRTYDLHHHLHKRIAEYGMVQAYLREQLLMPILMESTKRGIRLDREGLERDLEIYEDVLARANDRIIARLGLGDFNIDSNDELAEALSRAGVVADEDWVLTPTGKRSTSRPNLEKAIKDKHLLALLRYRGLLDTSLATFARPWLELTRKDGRLHTEWNQVRGDRTGDTNGTRTGRLSSSRPNFQNVINEFSELETPEGFPPLIVMRRYLVPDEGKVWLKRDFSSQEMRIMAHFAEGRLYEAYRADPKTDPHDLVKRIIKELLSVDMPRKYVKITGFGIMYGRGIPNLSGALGVPIAEGQKVRDAYFAALPEVRVLSNDTRNRGKRGQAIRTWGGRLYFREPHPERDLSYKLLNYLIQGSAADQTKQSIIDWNERKLPGDEFLATVHDENNIQAGVDNATESMAILREAMNADRFDVPFMSEGFRGSTWADIEECE